MFAGEIKVEVKVPKEAVLNGYADLRCEWRVTGGKNLYSVKWYKDDHEFFRYLPDNRESIQTFTQPGVHLEVSLCAICRNISYFVLELASALLAAPARGILAY